jgi:hypothetical protein
MVEKSECYKTKFGSIHDKEKDALEAEKKEEKEDFAYRFCKMYHADPWGYPKEVGMFVYENRDIFLKLLTTYDFINPIPEFVEVEKEEDE